MSCNAWTSDTKFPRRYAVSLNAHLSEIPASFSLYRWDIVQCYYIRCTQHLGLSIYAWHPASKLPRRVEQRYRHLLCPQSEERLNEIFTSIQFWKRCLVDENWIQNIWTQPNDLDIYMMKSSNGNIFRVTGHLCGEFTGPRWIPCKRPVTRRLHVFFDLRLNKLMSKQSWGWWFETLSRPLWRHCNVSMILINPFTVAC